MAYRVLIIEDHELFAESLEIALRSRGYAADRLQPLGAHATISSVLRDTLAYYPQAVLLDLDLGRFGAAEPLITPLTRAGVKTVVVSSTENVARLGNCVRLGACAFVSKANPLRNIVQKMENLRAGAQVMTEKERTHLLSASRRDRLEQAEMAQRLQTLTPGEREVLRHLVAGRTVREIAAVRVVAEVTVRTQVKAILRKLAVSSQLAAVGIANQSGWTALQPNGQE